MSARRAFRVRTGVAPLTAGVATAGGSLRQGQAYAVNGMPPEQNVYLVDGAQNGSLYDFVRSDAFDAKNYFSASVEPLKQNQFGVTDLNSPNSGKILPAGPPRLMQFAAKLIS